MILYSVGATIAVYATWQALSILWERARSPLRKLQGPASPSWLLGNLAQLFADDPGSVQASWLQQYGTTFKISGFFNVSGRDRLCTADPRALNHVLTHSADYQKPAFARYNLSRILGEGLLVAEGEAHRRQRRVMNPAFGPAQIRDLTVIFLEKATQLRDAWLTEVQSASSEKPVRLDALSWLNRATLDIIGLAGFNYQFNSLDGGKTNELNQAMTTMLKATGGTRLWTILQARIPPLRWVVGHRTARDRHVEFSQNTMKRIGYGLISERKAALRAEKQGAYIEKSDVQGRDLLSLLVKANMAVDVPEDQRLSDHEILSQIPTFMVAGHETTSTGTSWVLFSLTQAQNVQQKLREELLSVPTDTPSMDELDVLPYLDAVIREAMRIHAPVGVTTRVAMKDDVIPVKEPYVDKYGNMHCEIRVNRGDFIHIPIAGINHASHIWGNDAHEFKPERWLEPGTMPEAFSHNPGVWGHMLTFLGGPRACIGYRFSLVEMKAILFVLVRAFEFTLAVPAKEISKKSAVVTRPTVKGEPENGNQLPVFIKPYAPDTRV
ncbi:cytochrome P450 [Punctularia strigosozonata HHB-11173 SS5]|uniref:cytochrome P450 n=1 Tax=Punctularia strigosozonata (strain HHB-11173) TaxID=741275 RepID=UPI00044166ED|nr:cytochrome P450 [Punctularia strigosozonata HHB-11173 SS5]EIN14704.1 cytochrome P450 [Punctularia strigosozonata HHB-11173 SS5]